MAESIIYSLKIEGTDEELKALKAMSDEMKSLRDEIKKAEKEGSEQAEKKKLQLQAERKAYGELQKQIQNQNKETATSVRTLESMRAKLANMNKELEKLEFGSEEFKKLTAESKKLRDEINGAQEATGRFQGNVGNYSNAIQSAFQKMGISVGGYTKAVGTATVATRVLGSALIATGIGAIVVAVGLLAKAFFSTERGTQALSRALEPLRAIMQRLWGIVQELAVGLVDAFKDPQQAVKDLWTALKQNIVNRMQGLINMFGALGRTIKAAFTLDLDGIREGAKEFGDAWLQTLTGVEDVIGKIKGAFEGTVEAGSRIAEIGIELKKLAVERAENEARLTREMNEQREISRDVGKSAAERLNAAHKYLELQDQAYEYERRQARLEYERAQLKASFNDTDLTAQEELARARERLNEIDARQIKERMMVTARIATITKQQVENIAKLRDEYTKLLEAITPELVEINVELDKWLDFYDKDYQMQTLHLQRTGDNLAFERELYAQTYAGRAEAMQRMFDAGEIGEKRLAALQKQLAKEVVNAKLSAVSAGLQGVAQALGEETRAGKAAAVASAIIETWKAANMALANPPGPPISAMFAAAAVAQGLASVRNIMAVKEPPVNVSPVKRFATGVIGIDGKGSETSDSIPARISRGESVITAKATKVFAPVLANMERAVGNVPNTQLKNRRFAGGLIGQQFAPRTDMATDYERIIQRTIEAVGDIPVVVSETDITGTQELVRKIKVTGDLK